MKKYVVMELWGGLFNDDLEFEAKDKQDCIKQYLAKRNYTNKKAVYDSKKNHIQDSSQVICIQEGWYGQYGCKYIRGKRGFYKIIDK